MYLYTTDGKIIPTIETFEVTSISAGLSSGSAPRNPRFQVQSTNIQRNPPQNMQPGQYSILNVEKFLLANKAATSVNKIRVDLALKVQSYVYKIAEKIAFVLNLATKTQQRVEQEINAVDIDARIENMRAQAAEIREEAAKWEELARNNEYVRKYMRYVDEAKETYYELESKASAYRIQIKSTLVETRVQARSKLTQIIQQFETLENKVMEIIRGVPEWYNGDIQLFTNLVNYIAGIEQWAGEGRTMEESRFAINTKNVTTYREKVDETFQEFATKVEQPLLQIQTNDTYIADVISSARDMIAKI